MMSLEGICITEGEYTKDVLGPTYIFSPKELKTFSIRVKERINVGTWISAQLGASYCDVFEVKEYRVVKNPSCHLEFSKFRNSLVINTNICYKWLRRDKNYKNKVFVASVELGEVLADYPCYIESDCIYETQALFKLEFAHSPHGYFSSIGVLQKVPPSIHAIAMRAFEIRSEQRGYVVSPGLLSVVRETEDKQITTICIDICPSGSELIAECYSIEERKMYKFRCKASTIGKGCEVVIRFKSIDSDGISDVDLLSCNTSNSINVVLGRDGEVRIKTFVGISPCVQHESYDGKIFWAEKFRKVLRGDRCEKVVRYKIYWTYVRRVSLYSGAASTDIEFQICDLLNPVTAHETIVRCQKQMLDDEDKHYEMFKAKGGTTRLLSPRHELGQPSFEVKTQWQEKLRGNGTYSNERKPLKLVRKEQERLTRLYKGMNSDWELMLLTKKGETISEAWSRSLGRIMVHDVNVKGTTLFVQEGQWFYGPLSETRC